MNEHRHIEVSGRERRRDVFQVRADLIPAICVIRIVGRHLNCSSVFQQPEMVSSLLVGTAHGVVAPLVHRRMMIDRRLLLGKCDCGGHHHGGKSQKSFHVHFPFISMVANDSSNMARFPSGVPSSRRSQSSRTVPRCSRIAIISVICSFTWDSFPSSNLFTCRHGAPPARGRRTKRPVVARRSAAVHSDALAEYLSPRSGT